MDTIEGLLKTLGIQDYPEIKGDTCTVYLKDSDIFMKVYERLDNLEEFELDNIDLTEEYNTITYYNDYLYISLDAQYDENLYVLKIDKVK